MKVSTSPTHSTLSRPPEKLKKVKQPVEAGPEGVKDQLSLSPESSEKPRDGLGSSLKKLGRLVQESARIALIGAVPGLGGLINLAGVLNGFPPELASAGEISVATLGATSNLVGTFALLAASPAVAALGLGLSAAVLTGQFIDGNRWLLADLADS